MQQDIETGARDARHTRALFKQRYDMMLNGQHKVLEILTG